MVAVLVPALGHPQLNTWPHVHHRDGQGVQLVFTTLERERYREGKGRQAVRNKQYEDKMSSEEKRRVF